MKNRRLDIQGLRGIAVLLVVLFHSGLLRGGFIGVDVFFVISGFVITAMLVRERAAGGSIDLVRFYARRIKRLMPALAVAVGFAAIFCVLVPSPLGQPQETLKTAIATMLFSSNLWLSRSLDGYFALSAQDNPLLHMWSLSLEEQFYLVFPGVLAFLWMPFSGTRRWREPRVVLGCLALVSFSWAMAVSSGVAALAIGEPRNFLFFFPFTRAWEFLVGALWALWPQSSLRSIRASQSIAMLGLMAVLASGIVLDDGGPFPSWSTWLPVGGALLIISGGEGVTASRSRVLEFPPLVTLGDWSYSWYLWHWPFIVFAQQVVGPGRLVAAAAGLASIIPAALSCTFLESPIRHARMSERRSYLLLASCVVSAIAVSLVAERAVHFGWGQPWSMGAHVAMQRDCDKQPVDYAACTWNADSSAGNVIVAGDSQAWALADGIIAAATPRQLSTTVASMNGCPFVSPAIAVQVAGAACADAVERTLTHLTEVRPRALFIANAESYPAAAMGEGYRQLFERLRRASPHIALAVVRQPPGGDRFTGRRSILVANGSIERTIIEPPSLGESAPLLSALESVTVIDPRDTFCAEGACLTAEDGKELYSNSNHLSVQGALMLTPVIGAVLDTL